MTDDDLIRRGDALADRAVRVAEALRNIGPMLDLRLSGATIIYELLAQNAALRAEVRKSAMDAVSAGCQAQEAWENVGILQARVESLTAEVARLTRLVQMQPTRPQDAPDHAAIREAAQVERMQNLIDAYEDIMDYGIVFAKKAQQDRLKAAKEKLE